MSLFRFMWATPKPRPQVPLRLRLDKLHYQCNTQLLHLARRMSSTEQGAFRAELERFRADYLERYVRLQQSTDP